MTLHPISWPIRKPRFFNSWWYSWRAGQLARGFDLVYSHERVTRFDVMNVHCGTFVGGLWGRARGERKHPLRTWLKILTGPSIWGHWLLERCNNSPPSPLPPPQSADRLLSTPLPPADGCPFGSIRSTSLNLSKSRSKDEMGFPSLTA